MSYASHSACHSSCYRYWPENMARKEVSGPSLTVAQDTVDGSEALGGQLVQPPCPHGLVTSLPSVDLARDGHRAQDTGKMARKTLLLQRAR